MNKRDFELVLLREFAQLKRDCKKWQHQNADIIGVEFKELEIRIFELAASDTFYYSIKDPRYEQRPPSSMVTVNYKPRHASDKSAYGAGMDIDQVEGSFNMWLDLVRDYSSISLDVEDEFLNQYQKEYFEELKSVDVDADTAPFNDKQQRLLYYTLESIEEAIIEINNPQIPGTEIIEDSRKLREQIPKLTKNQVISKFSNIRAKIKIHGLEFTSKLGKKVSEIMAKKVIEHTIDYVLTHGPKFLEHFIH